MARKRTRASRSVKVVGPEEPDGDGPPRKNFRAQRMGTDAIVRDKVLASNDFKANMNGLDDNTIRAITAMRGEDEPTVPDFEDHGAMYDIVNGGEGDEDAWEDVEDAVEVDDDLMDELLKHSRPFSTSSKPYRKARDSRTWRNRIERLDRHWKELIPRLVDVYVHWRYPLAATSSSPHVPPTAPPPQAPAGSKSPAPQTCKPSDQPASDGHTPASVRRPSDEASNFEIKVLDIFDLVTTTTVSLSTSHSVCEALVANGYLGSSPVKPTLAISLRTLELLRCVRLFKPSFSIEAFAKLVCHYYRISYQRTIRNALSDAFDVYLVILRAVNKKVQVALGRDEPDWRARNACPACCYQLVGEPERPFARMICMDGNNSLKRMRPLGGRQIGDTRAFQESDYFLPQDFVNRFANEVQKKSQRNDTRSEDSTDHATAQEVSTADASPADVVVPDGVYPAATEASDNNPTHEPQPEGDPTDGAGSRGVESSCTKNWKAAQADEKKRSWDVFEETGIFASACRHGMVLWIIDMIRSGELARYPIAMMAKALDVLGERLAVGYDIGCAFDGTIRRSSLGPRFTQLHSRMCVNAFHGYSHEYSCQVQHMWSPLL
ncbi:hypothetical protein ONZ51_g10067 [Trametes cubensis]|uniref:CxC1-like cysteine cluster associated with KDZ transposases domain-containing protein n=1 Tax=Trametes cubensis TaxID=1111947 RepID=A0AAD7TKP7_9APHY|nr:hypothetical protein ONZ51_g10067 [Trametes cubensis]